MNENNIQIEQQSEAQAKRLLAYYSYLRKSQKMTQSELVDCQESQLTAVKMEN